MKILNLVLLVLVILITMGIVIFVKKRQFLKKQKTTDKSEDNDKKKKNIFVSHKEGLKQILSFVTMAVFATNIGHILGHEVKVWTISKGVEEVYAQVNYWVALSGIWIISFLWTRDIKPFHKGVPLILGRPIDWFTLPSGKFWILPKPFMDFEEVDVRQKDLDIDIKEALSKDNVKIDVDVLVKAAVSNPFQWLKTEEADKALMTLVRRNIRVFVNQIDSEKMPGQKIEFSTNLEKGVTFPELDEDGNQKSDAEGEKLVTVIESVSTVAADWGYGEGIAKCIINDIRLPEEMVKANIAKKVEEAQVETETTQQNLFLTQLGGGNIERGRKDFLLMEAEERAKNIQAERGKRTVITVDGNLPSIAKGLIAGAVISKGGK
ncbi:MAG: hypothetical protein KAJ58_02840 [Candidatus Pacebacteria bacterium]|nr:hypothetical protein [Candidatus Paceibacterota bacterium]